MSRTSYSTAAAAVGLAALGVLAAGCPDPPMAHVNVTVLDLRAAIDRATGPASFAGEHDISLTLCFIPEQGSDAALPYVDAQTRGFDDAGRAIGDCFSYEARRGAYFNQQNAFSFAVQVPARRYRAVRVAAIASVTCGAVPMPRVEQVASGVSAALAPNNDHAVDALVAMAPDVITPCQ